MAIELSNRTKILAGVVALAAAGAGAWFFLFNEDAPPPKPAAPPVAEKKADAPKAGGEASKAVDAGKGAAPAAPEAAKGGAAAKPAAKPIPTDPAQLVAEVVEASGVKVQYLAFARETLLDAVNGADAKQATDPADRKLVSDLVDRVLDPAKLAAELAAALKPNLDAERMARLLELLRQPPAPKMTSAELRNVPPEAMAEQMENLRKTPPSAARLKLIQSLEDSSRAVESATELTNAIARATVDAMLADLAKAGKKVPREARQAVGQQLNAIRGGARAQIRNVLLASFRGVDDAELGEYLKLLDTDTGRWGSELIASALRPMLIDRGTALGREIAKTALAKRVSSAANAPAEPAPEPLAKAQPAPEAAPPASAPAAAPPKPAEPAGYQRSASIRELYSKYNDLISATVMGDRAAVKELLDDGKPANARQADGFTPLMVAVSNGDAEIARLLLAKGADPNARANGGVTALSIAKARGAAGGAMVQLLQASGAKD